MILIIDHYDSFTYNLYQLLGELGEKVQVERYDKISVEDIRRKRPKAIVLSPGPGSPDEKKQSIQLIDTLFRDIPIIGICLGHQLIGHTFGAEITKAQQIKHGKTSYITHNGSQIFSYLSQPLEVMRYHSLVIEPESLSEDFDVLATSLDDKEIMAIKHKVYPLFGLQFHPESIGTKLGKQILMNFINNI